MISDNHAVFFDFLAVKTKIIRQSYDKLTAMKNIFYFVFFIFVLAFGLIFTIYNSTDVPFNYIVDIINLPLSLLIILAIVAGAILGLLASSIIILRLRNEITHYKKHQQKSGNV